MSVFVIGEMASAHDGDLGKAKQLVDVAVAAGCDAVKVQFWSDADRLADRRGVPQHYRDIYRKYQMPVKWLRILKEYCGERIEFMATCFLPEDAQTISPFVKRFKVSAFESSDHEFMSAICWVAENRIIIMSVNEVRGNPALDHILDLDELCDRSRNGIRDVLMYCETAYPARLSRIDLSQLKQSMEEDSHPVGFSDHTGDLDMGAYAVCAGATYIEAHMKLVNTDGLNPDGGSFAHLPAAFKQYVSNIRKAEVVMSPASRRSTEESRLKRYKVIA